MDKVAGGKVGSVVDRLFIYSDKQVEPFFPLFLSPE